MKTIVLLVCGILGAFALQGMFLPHLSGFTMWIGPAIVIMLVLGGGKGKKG